MIDKIILLTIFLYITLNLKKIDNFIQSGYKIEHFTATKYSKKEGVGRQKVDKVALNSGMIWGLIKLSVISCYMIYDTIHNFSIPYVLLTLITSLATIALIISYFVGAIDDLTSLTWLENIINEVSLVLGIGSLVNMAVSREHSQLKTTDFEDFYKKFSNMFFKDQPIEKSVTKKDKAGEDEPDADAPAASAGGDAPATSPGGDEPDADDAASAGGDEQNADDAASAGSDAPVELDGSDDEDAGDGPAASAGSDEKADAPTDNDTK
jgi:hypothetical protein